jgi:putative hydrolase of the HAD superfamily
MTAPRAVLFDIGSTLWSSPAEDPKALSFCYTRAREVLLKSLDSSQIPPIEALIEAVEGCFAGWEEVWRQDAGQVDQPPTTEYVARALAQLDLSPSPEALADFTNELLETSVHTARGLELEPGMAEALAGLKQLGLRLGCVSNAFMGAATLLRIMEERGLRSYFELAISSCEFGMRKPHPSIYKEAARMMQLRPQEIIFVGDRLDADVAGPAAAGMRTVLSHQYRQEDPSQAEIQPDRVVKHLSELVPYAASLLKDEATAKSSAQGGSSQ